MNDEEAIDIVARFALAEGAQYPNLDWADYAEIGEHDWKRVVKRAGELAPYPTAEEYEAAYALLESRAENDA